MSKTEQIIFEDLNSVDFTESEIRPKEGNGEEKSEDEKIKRDRINKDKKEKVLRKEESDEDDEHEFYNEILKSYNVNKSEEELLEEEKELTFIEEVIKNLTKKFPNEKEGIEILLDPHYENFRNGFFSLAYDKNKKYCYRRILEDKLINYKKEYIKKRESEGYQENREEDQIELCKLLSRYYKEKELNMHYFAYFLDDIKKYNGEKMNKDMLFLIPSNDIELLNEIQRKVTIIKDIRFYCNMTIRDLIQKNNKMIEMKDLKSYQRNKDSYDIYEYNVNLYLEELQKDERRPISDFQHYNYLPVLCQGYCLKEAEHFVNGFKRCLVDHLKNLEIKGKTCEKCEKFLDNFDEVSKQIKFLYKIKCIFAHNKNEVIYHPLIFKTKLNMGLYKDSKDAINENSLRIIYEAGDLQIKKIYDLLMKYTKKNNTFGKSCFLPDIKTKMCQSKDCCLNCVHNASYCKCYHDIPEKRRDTPIIKNEVCDKAFKINKSDDKGEWLTSFVENMCSNGDLCNKYHTRNEVFFDKRNYRKLYECTEKGYCDKGELCPRKHPIDINIDELYLPQEIKNKLKAQKSKLIGMEKEIKKLKYNTVDKYICQACLKTDMNIIYFFARCKHKICDECFEKLKMCPFCELNGISNEIKILLNKNYKNSKVPYKYFTEQNYKEVDQQNIDSDEENDFYSGENKNNSNGEEDEEESEKNKNNSMEKEKEDNNNEEIENNGKENKIDYFIEEDLMSNDKNSKNKQKNKKGRKNSNNSMENSNSEKEESEIHSQKKDAEENNSVKNRGRRGRGNPRGRGRRGKIENDSYNDNDCFENKKSEDVEEGNKENLDEAFLGSVDNSKMSIINRSHKYDYNDYDDDQNRNARGRPKAYRGRGRGRGYQSYN